MTAPGRLQQRPWRGVAAGAAVVFCVAVAYVAGRMEGGAAPVAAGRAPSQPQDVQPQDGTQSQDQFGDPSQGESGDEFGDGFQVPQDQAPSQGEPPVTQAS